MRQLERELERKCAKYARQHGWDCWKNENNSNKGIPDFSFLSPIGTFYLVEFKRDEKAHVRPEQIVWAEKHPDTVHFIHDFDSFTELINKKD